MNLKGRHILTLGELSKDEIFAVLSKAQEVKKNPEKFVDALKGKTISLLFSKPSTRTRVSFEAGIAQLGGTPLYLSSEDLQTTRGETASDTAKVLSKYIDALVIRTFAQSEVIEFAENSSVPVINGLTDEFHPCQALADLLTVLEIKGSLAGTRVAYFGDGNNIANTLALAGAITGIELVLASPKGYEVKDSLIDEIKKWYGVEIAKTDSPKTAAHMADFIYTDVWVSMGQEKEKEQRLKALAPFQVNYELLSLASPSVKVLHCLPAHRGEEITADVIDGPFSAVWQQAENRLHVQKALLLGLLGEA
jgi:ornithine carbamoyltransferase